MLNEHQCWSVYEKINQYRKTVYFDTQPGQRISGWNITLTDLPYASVYYIDNHMYFDYEDGILIRYIQPTYRNLLSMKLLINPKLVSAGVSSVPVELNMSTSIDFGRSSIGYTQTWVEWKLIDNSRAVGQDYYIEYNAYLAVYDITPIYAV